MLGGRAPAAFLAQCWQKQALLVRGAWSGAADLVAKGDLFRLAGRDDVESRLVLRERGRWSLSHGPFARRELATLPERGWTLLVQGVNLHDRAADRLLRSFAFLPFARLDDLMVSYAAPGGGVGPHFDSYDVFLLQGFGRRRWRYGRQLDLTLRTRLPLRILERFAPEFEHVLAPGDMLYLPPQYAHDGIAVDACTTYSIGFRAASANEVGTAFLDYLRDALDLPGRYADPDAQPTAEPARIDAAMQERYIALLAGISWTASTMRRFLGTWLSEPKPSVAFEPPDTPLPAAAFRLRAARHGLALDTRTQLLYDATHVFVNGDARPWPARGRDLLRALANARALPATACRRAHADTIALLHTWYRDGFLHLAT